MSEIKINKELMINVPEGFIASSNNEELGGERVFSAIKDDANWDMDYSLSEPFSAPQCILITNASELESFNQFALMKMLGMKISLSESGIRESLKKLIESLFSSLGYQHHNVIRDDSKMLAAKAM